MKHSVLSYAALVAAVVCVAASSVRAGIVPPPWDPNSPRQTLQAWTFTQSPTGGPFDASPVNNPNGVPVFDAAGSTGFYNPDNPVTGTPGTGVWGLPAGGTMRFFIPNYNELDPKEIFVSIKFSTHVQAGIPLATNTGVSGAPQGNFAAFPVTPVGPGVDMVHYFSTLPTCESFWCDITFPAAPGSVVFIEQVVVQTRCIPAPSATAVFGAAGLLAARRKRR